MLDLDEITLKNAEIFWLVLSGVGGSADGWRCCRGAPGRLPHLPPSAPKYPPPSITSSLLFFVFAKMGATSTASGQLDVNLFLSEKRGGKSQICTVLVVAVSEIWREMHCPISMEQSATLSSLFS